MQSMGELSHAQANPFQSSFEACQGDYSRLAGYPTWPRLDYPPYTLSFSVPKCDAGLPHRYGAKTWCKS